MMKSELVWLEHHKKLKQFVLLKVRDKENASDILQDVFIKLHSNMDSLREPDKMKSWLFQVTRNAINDYFRKQKFSVDVDELDLPMETETSKTNDQFSGCVKPHLNKLPLIYKEAIMKTEFGNYSQLELAEELKISYSGAKSRVQRAKELLKSYFKQCCNVSTDKYGNILSHDEKHECKLC